jgi:hypothetical protein
MEPLNYLYLVPLGFSIFFLGLSVIFSTIVSIINTIKIVSALKQNTSKIDDTRYQIEKSRINSEGFKEEIVKARISTDNFNQTLQKMCWWLRR